MSSIESSMRRSWNGFARSNVNLTLRAAELRERYLATGVVTEQDLDEYCRFADDPRTWAVYYATVVVSSRKSG